MVICEFGHMLTFFWQWIEATSIQMADWADDLGCHTAATQLLAVACWGNKKVTHKQEDWWILPGIQCINTYQSCCSLCIHMHTIRCICICIYLYHPIPTNSQHILFSTTTYDENYSLRLRLLKILGCFMNKWPWSGPDRHQSSLKVPVLEW